MCIYVTMCRQYCVVHQITVAKNYIIYIVSTRMMVVCYKASDCACVWPSLKSTAYNYNILFQPSKTYTTDKVSIHSSLAHTR